MKTNVKTMTTEDLINDAVEPEEIRKDKAANSDAPKKPKKDNTSIDLEYAIQVIQHYGKSNIIHHANAIYLWRGGYWQRQDDREVQKTIHKVAGGDNKLNQNKVKSILEMTKTEIAVSDDIVNKAPNNIINCINGELHFINGKWQLLEHNKQHYFTTQMPVKYDSDANAPRFTQFLQEIFTGDDDATAKAQVVLEMIGYSMLRTCELEKFIILIGNGANGKSVLIRVLSALLGKSNIASVCPSQFENRFQRAHLYGKLANIISELAQNMTMADAALKALVSGELITAEYKHKPPFDFCPYCTCWFGTNHMPQTRDFSDAIFRRAIVITFNCQFKEGNRDPQLASKLLNEIPGVLNMALEAVANVLNTEQFTDPPSSVEAKAMWRLESDHVQQFMDEKCELGGNYESSSSGVYTSYQKWTDSAGVRPYNRVNFTNRLKRHGIETVRGTNGIRKLYGIQLIDIYE